MRIEIIKYIESFILTIILILAFVLRIYKIDNPVADWHSFRQVDTASVTRTYIEEGMNLLYPRYHDISTTQSGLFNPNGYRFVEFPVFNALHVMAMKLMPTVGLDVWGRMISIISSLVSVVIIFFIGKRYISFIGGVMVSMLFALNPFSVYFSRVILPEQLAVMLGLISVFTFSKYIDTQKIEFIIVTIIFFTLAILVKPYLVFFSLPVIYLSINKYGLRGVLKNKTLILSAITILLPFLLWRMWMSRYPEGIPFWKWTFNDDGIRFKPAYWYWIFGERLGVLILGVYGVIPFLFGLLGKTKGSGFVRSFFGGALLFLIIIATANVRHDYYQTIITPSIFLAFAGGVMHIWKEIRMSKIKRILLIGISFSLMIVVSGFRVKEFYKINNPSIIIAGMYVDKHVSKDALVIAPYNGDTAFLYQTKRSGWPVVDRPIDELIELGADYFISVDLGHYQTIEFGRRFYTVAKTDRFIIFDLKKEL